MKKAIEIIEYLRKEEMDNDNTPFSLSYYDEALKEISEIQLENAECLEFMEQLIEDKEHYNKNDNGGLRMYKIDFTKHFSIMVRDYCGNFNKPIKFGCSNFQCTLGVKIPFSKKAIFITRIK